MRKLVVGVSDHTNPAVQPHKMVISLKFRIKIEKGLYHPYSENKGADQLRGNREADLCLYFRICKKPVFLRRGSNHDDVTLFRFPSRHVKFTDEIISVFAVSLHPLESFLVIQYNTFIFFRVIVRSPGSCIAK